MKIRSIAAVTATVVTSVVFGLAPANAAVAGDVTAADPTGDVSVVTAASGKTPTTDQTNSIDQSEVRWVADEDVLMALITVADTAKVKNATAKFVFTFADGKGEAWHQIVAKRALGDTKKVTVTVDGKKSKCAEGYLSGPTLAAVSIKTSCFKGTGRIALDAITSFTTKGGATATDQSEVVGDLTVTQ